MTGPSIVWLRDELRLADNPALTAAASWGEPIVLLYVLDEVSPGIRPLGSASRWWLHHSLSALAESVGGCLVLRHGAAEEVLPAVVSETGASAVYWNRRYSAAREIDARLKTSLRAAGLTVESFAANLLFEPWTVMTGQGQPYKVFTPFWRACLEREVRGALPTVSAEWVSTSSTSGAGSTSGASSTSGATSDDLDEWGLLPTRPDWAAGLRAMWTPGEAGAHARLSDFVTGQLTDYHRRDEPAVEATSHLSPHLRFGEVSPFQVWEAATGVGRAAHSTNSAKFLSEVGWREFNANILFHTPELATENFRPAYDSFPWDEPEPAELEAWQQGRTGIPLVDAGMRELWRTGYMHNRVRMVVASFLVKNLLVDWRVGEQWFWDTLVDADEASNPGNWQWVAGSGADAAPYFRVFNPELQRVKFDPDSEYVRRWVPEWGTPEYPEPIVDLAQSRKDALAAYEVLKRAAEPR